MTLTEYDRLVDLQLGQCAICGREPGAARALSVDHDHATGRIRGLLCFRCNRYLVHFWRKEAAWLFRAAADYLEGRRSYNCQKMEEIGRQNDIMDLASSGESPGAGGRVLAAERQAGTGPWGH